jgi:hypothetical protein
VASEIELIENKEAQEMQSMTLSKRLIFAKDRLITNLWRLLDRFKRKCFKHLLFLDYDN